MYSMVNETGNRNRNLVMCKCQIWFRLIITSTIRYRFSPNFARSSEMWSLRWLLFVRQTERSLPILEMCGLRFWQFSGSSDHIFQQISTKSHVQIKFSNAHFVFNGEWNWKSKSDFRDVRISDLVSIRYYVQNSLPIFTKFCKRLRNVVASTPICETTRKQFSDFRGVRIPISAVFRLWSAYFSTDQHQIPCTDKIPQCRLCTQWWVKPEVEIGF